MPLDTRKLAWRATIGLSILLATHAAMVPNPARPLPDGVLTIHQSHRVQGEDYLLRADKREAVLVGSSLSESLPQIALGPVYNLALSGGSAYSGLAILSAARSLPKVVLVEANVLDRPADAVLLGELLNPLVRRVKEACTLCRSRNQPLTLVLSHLSWLRLPSLDFKEAERRALDAPPESRNPATFSVQLAAAGKLPDTAGLRVQLAELTEAVRTLQRRGARVMFVELPQDPQIASGARHQAVMAAVRESFPESGHRWVRWPGGEARTRDGVHLVYHDAHRMAHHVRSAIDVESNGL